MHEQHLALALGRRCRRALHQVVGDVLERRAPVLGATDTDEDGRDRAEAEALYLQQLSSERRAPPRRQRECDRVKRLVVFARWCCVLIALVDGPRSQDDAARRATAARFP